MSAPAKDFWSRRKAQVAAEASAEAQVEEALARREAEAAQEARTDEDILAELELPMPEDLQPGDDFSAFMKQAVPDRIRRRALRVLWRTNPVLANIDGLVDYGEDYTDAATVVENLQTSYQVGKGMLKHLLAEEEAKEKAAAIAEDHPEDDPQPETEPEVIVAAAEPQPEPDTGTGTVSEPHQEETPVRAMRRIRFDFAEPPQPNEETA